MSLLESDIANRGKGGLVLYGRELLFSIWNLDSPRLVYISCLQPYTNTHQVLALDYIIAVYPLLLIAPSYLLVLLYDHNVRLIVCLWKPLCLFLSGSGTLETH